MNFKKRLTDQIKMLDSHGVLHKCRTHNEEQGENNGGGTSWMEGFYILNSGVFNVHLSCQTDFLNIVCLRWLILHKYHKCLLGLLSLSLSFFLFLSFFLSLRLFIWAGRGAEGEGEGETGSLLSTEPDAGGSVPGPQHHDLSLRQILNQLSHPSRRPRLSSLSISVHTNIFFF